MQAPGRRVYLAVGTPRRAPSPHWKGRRLPSRVLRRGSDAQRGVRCHLQTSAVASPGGSKYECKAQYFECHAGILFRRARFTDSSCDLPHVRRRPLVLFRSLSLCVTTSLACLRAFFSYQSLGERPLHAEPGGAAGGLRAWAPSSTCPRGRATEGAIAPPTRMRSTTMPAAVAPVASSVDLLLRGLPGNVEPHWYCISRLGWPLAPVTASLLSAGELFCAPPRPPALLLILRSARERRTRGYAEQRQSIPGHRHSR